MENSSNSSGSDPDAVIQRIREGDCEALAEHLMAIRSRVLRRVRAKLRTAGMTIIDPDDVFSSAGRRLLIVCKDGRFGDFWEDDMNAYIFRTVMNVVEDKVRMERSQRKRLAQVWLERLDSAADRLASEAVADEGVIAAVLSQLAEDDREIFDLQLRGVPHDEIVRRLGLTKSTYFARRQRLAQRLCERASVALPF